MERSSHKTTRERERQQIYPPTGDGLKTLLIERAVSEELRVYFEQIIGFIGDPSAEHPIACPISIQPNKQPISIRRRKIKLSEVTLFIHPMVEILENISHTTPRPKPRGRFISSHMIESHVGKPSLDRTSMDLVSPSQYHDPELLEEDLDGRPLRCLELAPDKYLYLDSVQHFSELRAHGYRSIPFLVRRPSEGGVWDDAIIRSMRRAFESVRGEPSFLRPEVRRQLVNVLVSVGLSPLIFKSLPLCDIYKMMHISGSTTRASRGKTPRHVVHE